jgi:hypothetical protein
VVASPEQIVIETMFRIPDKEGRDVDFILNREQRRFLESSTGKDIIAKARQLGFSMLILGLFLARCLIYRNRRCVIVSHSVDHTQKLLERVKYMIKHMKGAEPDIRYSTQNFITFGKMDSSIYIGTAGNPDFGVGDTITDLHCSEVSRWEKPGPLLSGLFQAVSPNGHIYIESTGRGTGNWFHRACMRAANGQGYHLHFVSWLEREEYRVENDEPFVPDEALEEFDCIQKFSMTVPQLKWRRMKIAELDGDIQQFKEQYPCALAECFQATGNSFFTKIPYQVTPKWKKEDPWTWRLEGHPKEGAYYAAGADPSGGVGQDAAVLEIFEIETGEQVLEYSNNRIEADRFAAKCATFLCEFNDAFLNFERNNHGILFASEIVKCYRKDRIAQSVAPRVRARVEERKPETRKLAEWGTYTTDVSKNLMCGRFRSGMREGLLVLYSAALQMECQTFVEDASGRLGAETGCNDDKVMASIFAYSMFERAANVVRAGERRLRDHNLKAKTHHIFSLDAIIEELGAKYDRTVDDGCPVSCGVDESENSYY